MTRRRSGGTMRALAALAAGALALGASAVLGSNAAHADPSQTPTPAPTPAPNGSAPASTATGTSAAGTSAAGNAAAGDVLDQLAEQYSVGTGGGQVSNLLKVSLRLRAMGFTPSKANLAEIAQAMNYRPNQLPLIEALKDTIAYQQKIKAQMEILQQYQQQQANNAVLGASQMPPGMGQPGAPVGTAPVGAAPGEAMLPGGPPAPPMTP